LSAVQRDEAKNCAILMDSIRRWGGTPSTAMYDSHRLNIEAREAPIETLETRISLR